MFTGIVEELGQVLALDPHPDALTLTIGGPLVTGDARPGDSIAVNGCCLTVVTLDGPTFTADLMQETLDKTSLGSLEPGSPVNLERSVTATGRLGGHIVQGHVDGTGHVVSRHPSQHWDTVTFALPSALARYVVPKGSIAVDGTSLTVVEVDDDAATFTVGLIPETLQRTTLGLRQAGDLVNLEVDIIAKYVERLVTR
ncbi:riboflavin synthase [Tessaracoccus sp. Y1736]